MMRGFEQLWGHRQVLEINDHSLIMVRRESDGYGAK
jgi:hypothetical protein